MLKFDRPTLVTLTAPTASGKNYLRDAIEKKFGWTRIVSTTTRPMRAGEVEGEDYNFISRTKSLELEAENKFAELITFRGTRYGVTRAEMESKMDAVLPPMVILEPQGLQKYREMCREHDWDIFSIYISVQESVRIQRLHERTVKDICSVHSNHTDTIVNTQDRFKEQIDKLVAIHTDRLLSITTEERLWSNVASWDAMLPGDDVDKALADLEVAVKWRNRKVAEPTVYNHVDHHLV